jgi:hypothetical protein
MDRKSLFTEKEFVRCEQHAKSAAESSSDRRTRYTEVWKDPQSENETWRKYYVHDVREPENPHCDGRIASPRKIAFSMNKNITTTLPPSMIRVNAVPSATMPRPFH